MRALCCLVIVLAFSACVRHKTLVRSPAGGVSPDTAAFIDLQPDWRVRVVMPLTKSGTYLVNPTREQKAAAASGGLDMTLSANRDFIGYQTSFYSVQSRVGTGVRIRFVSAEDTKKGVTVPQARPRLMLFALPRRAKYVRLVYLARASRADHDMAIVAASARDLLESFTRNVQANPRTCVNSEHTFCSWVPAGIAVQPEIPRHVNGAIAWEPAR